MSLYTDILSPSAVTEIARRALVVEEQSKPTLAAFLPNVTVDTPNVQVDVEPAASRKPARFRAFDAEPEFGGGPVTQKRLVQLVPVSQQEPVGEYQQLIAGIGDNEDARLKPVVRAIRNTVSSIVEAAEVVRAGVLTTGNLVVNQRNFQINESFGRAANQTVTASTLWSDPSANVIDQLLAFSEVYQANNGGTLPGTILVSPRVMRLIASKPEFATQLSNGGTRPAGLQDINAILDAQGLPTLTVYNRTNANGRLIADDTILLLPAPGETSATDFTELGGTAWGPTLVGRDLNWDLALEDQSGIVAGIYRNEKPPAGIEVVADSLMLPILRNANLSFAAKVV